MRGDASLLFQSSVATSLVNADSSRRDHPSLDVRREGWTEVWGGLEGRGGGSGSGSDSAAAAAGGAATARSERRRGLSPPSDWDHERTFARRTLDSSRPPLAPSSGGGGGGARSTLTLTLTQHRVAWTEQLALRVARVPHVVLNSAYSSSEATGPLPFLTDLGGAFGATSGGGEGSDGADGASGGGGGWNGAGPGLVGRRNPGGMAPRTSGGVDAADGDGGSGGKGGASSSSRSSSSCGSDIVEYLRLRRSVDLDCSLDPSLRSESLAYATLIAERLDVALAALRYGDEDAWEQVYRPQRIEACLRPDGHSDGGAGGGGTTRRRAGWGRGVGGIFFHWMAWFQAWTERTVAMRELLLSNSRRRDELFDGRAVRVGRAVGLARTCYDALDAKLAGGGGTHLLDTAEPTAVDVVLFAHLADALCDVHLVTVLAEYGHLVKFFQGMYETYFGRGYGAAEGSGGEPRADWIRWNDRANAVNAFNQIPIGDGGGGGIMAGMRGGEYKDAIAIMQSMALHCRDLGEALTDAALQRKMEDEVAAKGKGVRTAGEMFYRWRMGGTLRSDAEEGGGRGRRRAGGDSGQGGYSDEGDQEEEEEEDETTRKNRAHMERMQRENKTNDELWVSGVVLGSALAFVFAAAKAAAEER